MGKRHCTGIGDGTAGWYFQVRRSPVPEVRKIQAGVERSGCIDRALVPIVANRCLKVVATTHAQVVAGIAGYKSGLSYCLAAYSRFSTYQR
jgi:hypothetical protein